MGEEESIEVMLKNPSVLQCGERGLREAWVAAGGGEANGGGLGGAPSALSTQHRTCI